MALNVNGKNDILYGIKSGSGMINKLIALVEDGTSGNLTKHLLIGITWEATPGSITPGVLTANATTNGANIDFINTTGSAITIKYIGLYNSVQATLGGTALAHYDPTDYVDLFEISSPAAGVNLGINDVLRITTVTYTVTG